MSTNAAARPIGDRRTSLPARATHGHRRAVLLQIVTLLPIAAAYAWFTLLVRGAHGFSGDEPHYLAFTQGLWLYHTLDQHRVLYHHDFLSYYPYLMSSHAVHRGGHLYSLHYLGLPLVLLPGFALAGVAGAQLTTALIGVLACWRALRVATRVAGPVAAAVAVGVLGLSAPFVLNAASIYPDLLSGLLLVLAYEAAGTAPLSPRRAVALGLVLAVCPWVHVKLLVAVGVFMAWTAWMLVRRARTPHGHAAMAAALALGVPLLSLAGLMLYNLALYGSPSPAAPYSGPTLFTGNPLTGIVGQLFAQGQGALGTAPFVVLVVPGAVALWRRDRATALKIALATVPFWLVTLTYRDWWGGDAPPLRYLLPVLPLWTTAIAAGLAAWRCVASRLAVGALAAATLALTLVIPSATRLGWPLPGGQGALVLALGKLLHLPLATWLPAFEPTRSGPGVWHHAALVALWAALLLAAWALLAWRERTVRVVPLK